MPESGADEAGTISQAIGEIDRLRGQVKLLREALETCEPGDYTTGFKCDPHFDEEKVRAARVSRKVRGFVRLPYWRFRHWAWRKRSGVIYWHVSISEHADTSTWDGLADIYRDSYRMATCKDRRDITDEVL